MIKKLLLLLFIPLQCFALSKKQRHVAVLVEPNYRGENSFAHRIQSACKSLHWTVDIVDVTQQREELENSDYDFIINLVPTIFKHPRCKTYLAIFDPTHNYFNKKGSIKRKYRIYDGYLLTYTPKSDDVNFVRRKLPFMKWYPCVQKMAYKKVDPSRLFYVGCIWGNRFEDEKFRAFLHLLDQEAYTSFYGSPIFQDVFANAYKGTISYDGGELYKIASGEGISLVLHSAVHNDAGVPSGRIFEAAASSTVIISDENAFVRKHFGDSVLYINTQETAASIFDQIHKHVQWIKANKSAALKKAKRAHKIGQKKFSLEKQLENLDRFHQRVERGIFSVKEWIFQGLFALVLCFFAGMKIRERKKARLFPLALFAILMHILPLDAHARVNSLPSPTASGLVKFPIFEWIDVYSNREPAYTLINSVDFHPKKNLFCATFTHSNKVILFNIDANDALQVFQSFSNPFSQLSEPQHAVFSPDGEKIAVANWTNQTINIYTSEKNGFFNVKPKHVLPSPHGLNPYKPHGIAFSPCGEYLAIAYAGTPHQARAIALYRFREEGSKLELVSQRDVGDSFGSPKGIAFSPDGKCLLVTFCKTNSLAIFELDENHSICSVPRQVVQGEESGIVRPEDVKLSSDSTYCAVSNSEAHTVTFYPFDKNTNAIVQNTPFYTLHHPKLHFPHGLAFSQDGQYLVVTQFGPIIVGSDGYIYWTAELSPQASKIYLYKIDQKLLMR